MCLEAPGVKARGGKGQDEAGGGCCGKQTENKMYNSTKNPNSTKNQSSTVVIIKKPLHGTAPGSSGALWCRAEQEPCRMELLLLRDPAQIPCEHQGRLSLSPLLPSHCCCSFLNQTFPKVLIPTAADSSGMQQEAENVSKAESDFEIVL